MPSGHVSSGTRGQPKGQGDPSTEGIWGVTGPSLLSSWKPAEGPGFLTGFLVVM